MLIPNESLLYDTETKLLHLVPNITYTNDKDEVITRSESEWEKGAALGIYTYNLVPKSYMFGYRPGQAPAPFEDVTSFATETTTKVIISKLERKFMSLKFGWTGITEKPKDYKDRVILVVMDNEGKRIEMQEIGYYAVIESQHGTAVMLQMIYAGLIEGGLL